MRSVTLEVLVTRLHTGERDATDDNTGEGEINMMLCAGTVLRQERMLYEYEAAGDDEGGAGVRVLIRGGSRGGKKAL